MGTDAPLCYVWLGTMQKMANAAKCKFLCMNIPCCYVFGFLSSHCCLGLGRVLSTQDVNNLSRVNKIIWFYQLG